MYAVCLHMFRGRERERERKKIERNRSRNAAGAGLTGMVDKKILLKIRSISQQHISQYRFLLLSLFLVAATHHGNVESQDE